MSQRDALAKSGDKRKRSEDDIQQTSCGMDGGRGMGMPQFAQQTRGGSYDPSPVVWETARGGFCVIGELPVQHNNNDVWETARRMLPRHHNHNHNNNTSNWQAAAQQNQLQQKQQFQLLQQQMDGGYEGGKRQKKNLSRQDITKNQNLFFEASDELKGDKGLVLQILGNCGWTVNGTKVLENASAELREDREVVMTAIAKGYYNPDLFKKASAELRADKDLVLQILRNGGGKEFLKHASAEVRNHRDVVITAAAKGNYDIELFFEASHRYQDLTRGNGQYQDLAQGNIDD